MQNNKEVLRLAKERLLVDQGLIYSLRDGANYYEINVTMASGSRNTTDRIKLTEEIAALLTAKQVPVSGAVDELRQIMSEIEDEVLQGKFVNPAQLFTCMRTAVLAALQPAQTAHEEK